MLRSSCVVGPLQGTASQFSHQPSQHNGTTITRWHGEQKSRHRQPSNAYFRAENGFVPNRSANEQNLQTVSQTGASGQQLNNFINRNQCHSSLNAHNGQSFLSNGSFPVQNVQPQDSEISNNTFPNTNIYYKQDVPQNWTQKQTHVDKQTLSADYQISLIKLFLTEEIHKDLPKVGNQLNKQYSLQKTTSQEKLNNITYNRQMVNNRHGTQTLCQEGLSAFSQLPRNHFSTAQAKTTGVQQKLFQHSNVSQTTQQLQSQVNPEVNFADKNTYQKQGHQIRNYGIGFHQCKAQAGCSNSSSSTGTAGLLYIHNNGMIPQKQSNHNMEHVTLNTLSMNSDTSQPSPPFSGQAPPTINASNPSAALDDISKKSLKAVAVVQPLEQEGCLNDASMNNPCKTVKDIDPCVDIDKSVQPSSITTITWTIETLTKLLENLETAQQKDVMGLTEANSLPYNILFHKLKEVGNDFIIKFMNGVAKFCKDNLTKDCVILTEVKGSYDENYCVMKHGELYFETPYKSQWRNIGELDDIDKEFGYAPCLKNGRKQSDQALEVTSIPAQNVNEECAKVITLIEPELNGQSKEKRILNSAERKNCGEVTQNRAPSPMEDSLDSSDSDFSFKIQVLSPEKAKAVFEQIKKKTGEAIAVDSSCGSNAGSSDQKLSGQENVTESEERARVLYTEYCCLPRFFSTFLKKESSYSKCQCESAKTTEGNAEKLNIQEKETAMENLSGSLSCRLEEGGNKDTGEIKHGNQTMKRCDSELLYGLNQPVAPIENKKDCRVSDPGSIKKNNNKDYSCNPLLYHLLLSGKMDKDALNCAKIQSDAEVHCKDVVPESEKTCSDTELTSKDMTPDSLEGPEAQSSCSETATREDLAAEVKQGPCKEKHLCLKDCSNPVEVKPLSPKSQKLVTDLTEDGPVPSSEKPSGCHPLLSPGKDNGTLSDVERQLHAKVDDIVVVSDSDTSHDKTLDSIEAQSPISEMAMAEDFALKSNTSTLPIDVKQWSPKNPEVTVSETDKLFASKEKIVKLVLFGSKFTDEIASFRKPPKVLSVNLSCVKKNPSEPTLMQEQSAKQRVYEKWKTSIVPVLAVGNKMADKRRSSTSLFDVHRKRAAYVGSTVTENVPIRSESRIFQSKPNEKIELKRRRLSSSEKPVEWKISNMSATKDRDRAAVPPRGNDVKRFRIPNTF